MRYGSVCSGIEAATQAWQELGFKAAWLSEIDKFPSALLAHHYPQVPNLGDMKAIAQKVRAGEVEAPDILVGGTPCQSFSIAGLRSGLSDQRGELTLRFVELANEIDAARVIRGKPPVIIVWENVPGVFSSTDNAFGYFLAGLVGESSALQSAGRTWTNAGCVFGPQRAAAWRTFDAQYFGLAQRRNRVFVVASAGNQFDPSKILFEFDGVRLDVAPSRESGQKTTENAGFLIEAASAAQDGGLISHVAQPSQDPAYCLETTCHDYSRADGFNTVVHQKAYSFDSLSSNSMRSDNPNSGCREVELSKTLDTSQPCPAKNQGGLGVVRFAYGVPGNWIGRQPENGGNAVEPPYNISPCLTGADRHGVAFLSAANHNNWSDALCFQQNSRSEVRFIGGDGHITGALPASVGSQQQNYIFIQYGVRRLTVTECERLQGFKYGYTKIPYRNKPAALCADSPRYKAIGNSMAVPVMRWIGERIKSYLSLECAA